MAITAVAITTTLKKNNLAETIDDPLSMFLNRRESNGEGRTGPKKSFYCQQEHSAKSVGNFHQAKHDVGDTICTGDNMKVINNKGDLSYYKLTHQTCSKKSENCIFVTGKYTDYKNWNTIPYKNIFYCNMCAIRGRHLEENENVTTMCGSCKLSCQEKEEMSTSSKGDRSERQKRPRRTIR